MRLSLSSLLSQAVWWLLVLLVAHPAQSAPLDLLPDPASHTSELPTADAGPPLSLDEAARLSLVNQPILTASLAWLDVYEAEQSLILARQLTSEAMLEVQSLEKDYGSGKASQADWLAAKVEASLMEDKAHDWLHHSQRMRAGLARWIGDDAQRPIAKDLSLATQPAALPALMAAVDHHPVIGESDKQIETSATDISLARQAYKPDVSVEGYVAYRPGFSDFVGIQVTVDLPYFTKNRQNPQLAAAFQRSPSGKAGPAQSGENRRSRLRRPQRPIGHPPPAAAERRSFARRSLILGHSKLGTAVAL